MLKRYKPFVGFFSELKFFKNARLLIGLLSPFPELVAVKKTTLPDDPELEEIDRGSPKSFLEWKLRFPRFRNHWTAGFVNLSLPGVKSASVAHC